MSHYASDQNTAEHRLSEGGNIPDHILDDYDEAFEPPAARAAAAAAGGGGNEYAVPRLSFRRPGGRRRGRDG